MARTRVKIDTKDAWNAVQAFEHMIPQLRTYARAMTGNARLQVQVTAGPTRTDGNTIFITPPLALASKEVHSKRSECGKRAANGKLTCKACNLREVINFYLFHEVSHILWGTLADYNEYSLALWHRIFEEWHHEDCEHYAPMLTKLDSNRATMGLANLLTPFTGMMLNALEDARVNERTFEVRPGLRKIFAINMDRMLIDGSESLMTGEMCHWRDQPLDAQFMVGLYFEASGYDASAFLADEAMEMLRHPEIVALTGSVRTAANVDETFEIVIKIWLVAQKYGFCIVEKCVKPELSKEDGDDPDDGDAAEDAAGDEDDSAGDDGADGTGEEPDDSGAGSGPPESGGSAGGGAGTGAATPAESDDGSTTKPDPGGEPPAGGSSGSASDSDVPDREDGDVDDRATGRESEAGPDGISEGTGAETPDDDGTPGEPEPGDGDTDSGDGESAGPGSASAKESEEPDGVAPVIPSAAEGSDEVDHRGPEADPDESGDGPDDRGDPGDEILGNSDADEDSDADGTAESLPGEADEGDRVRGGWIDAGPARYEESTPLDDAPAGSDPAWAERSSEEDLDVADADPTSERRRDDFSPDDGVPDSEERPAASDGPDPDADDAPDGPVDGPSGPVGTSDGPTLGHGTPDDAATALGRVIIHKLLEDMAGEDLYGVMGGGEDGHPLGGDALDALTLAIAQRIHFDEAAYGVLGLNKLPYPCTDVGWQSSPYRSIERYMPSPALLARPTLLARRFFEANAMTKIDSNRKSGRVNARVLGRRAPTGDPRLFGKKALPKKHSYAVTIVVDCSGSMGDENMEKIKRYTMAMAEILHRLGIPFSVFGHSASSTNLDDNAPRSRFEEYGKYWMYIMPVKEMHEPWNDKGREKLVGLSSLQANLDGHALEYARKSVMQADATDRIIFYFSDGGLPAENSTEEKEIITREITWCRKNKVTLLGGGIDSNATAKVGMDTVILRRQEDITKLIEFLQKNLTRSE
jgi:hypothetical protein